jgi:hydroxypyruvate isomerase
MPPTANAFKLNYAPHFNMFENLAGKDIFDQLRFMADQGFRALEDSALVAVQFPNQMGIGMLRQPPELLSRIGDTLASLGMEMGTMAWGPTFWPPQATLASGKPELREEFLKRCRQAVEVLKHLGGRYVTLSPDTFDYSLPLDLQTANVIEGVRYAADIFEPHGITMLLEPLSDAPQLFLRTSKQAYMICKAIDRKSCKILFDMYHLQRNEGRLIHHMDVCWEEIGYFQIGDEPGRKEPTTGEVNYRNIFKHIAEKSAATNRSFILGMEHHNSQPGKEGELAVIEAYRWCDDF